MTPVRDQITGLLLAGGRGSRMGGADKGLIPLRGEPLAAHVLRRLVPQVGGLLVSANRHLDEYRRFGWPVLSDGNEAGEAFAGPLAGLLAGLRACPTDWLLCAPCDTPLLPPDLAARLAAGLGGAPLALALDAQGRAQPGCCLLRRELAAPLADYLAGGGRRVLQWQLDQGAARVAFDAPGDDPDAFANLNHPGDLQALERPQAPRLQPG